jgi:ankyrin repeat protein
MHTLIPFGYFRSQNGETPLYWAEHSPHRGTTRINEIIMCLKQNQDLKLLLASRNGETGSVRELLQQKANVNFQNAQEVF